jgi:DNA-binding XRE family transcriptional regulator
MASADMLNIMQPYGSLDNYILSLRKQTGLSQHDLAFLLDDRLDLITLCEQQGEDVLPRLKSAIALELVFHEPVQRIFAGIAEKMRAQVAARARILLQGMSDKTTADNALKLQTLAGLAHVDEEDVTSWNSAA